MARETTKPKGEPKPIFKLPEGRLINHSLFERDSYTDERGIEGTPMYKVELAFNEKDIMGQGTIEDDLLDAVLKEWGDTQKIESEFFNGTIRAPFLDGNELAKKREEKGKDGSAYKGKWIIRAATKYNAQGLEGPGGIQVFDEEAKEVSLLLGNASSVYNGCYGHAAVTIATGKEPGRSEQRYVKFFLSAFQKTRDGEKLVAAKDMSSLFKPVGRTEGASEGRRSRRG